MGKILKHFLIVAICLPLAGFNGRGPRFYPDDPITADPPPMRVERAKVERANEYYDFFLNTMFTPGERVEVPRNRVPAQAVNTLGEVPDSAWYTNRRGLTLDDLRRGPGNANPPSGMGHLIVRAAKTEGIMPGFVMEDFLGRSYLVKVDPPTNPEMATAAEVVTSKIFHALGYNVPENYVFFFRRADLIVSPDARIVDKRAIRRQMTNHDVDSILEEVPRLPDGRYRAVASLYLPGKPLGPFDFFGTRPDDPNDLVPHEHRRDLRGLDVFSSWVNHTDAKSLNSLDTLVEEGDLQYIKHHLIDFGGSLGSDSFEPKSPRAGHDYLFAWKPAAVQFFSLGLYVPRWTRIDYPDSTTVGNFTVEGFQPDSWKPNYPNAAFLNRLPDDTYWAAKKVMAFSEPEIRAMVETGQYSNPAAVDYITATLIERQKLIGRTYFAKVLALEDLRAENGELRFRDLEVDYGFAPPRQYTVEWWGFDNDMGRQTLRLSDADFTLPPELNLPGTYVTAHIAAAGEPAKKVIVYLRNQNGRKQVVGIDRIW